MASPPRHPTCRRLTTAGFAGLNVTFPCKEAVLPLLDEASAEAREIGAVNTVVIGAEHPDPSLRPFSLVASTYDDGTGIGTIGVIGPTRMRYSRAIAVVDGAAQAVSRVLRDPN